MRYAIVLGDNKTGQWGGMGDDRAARWVSRAGTRFLLIVALGVLLNGCSSRQGEQAALAAVNQSMKREMVDLPLALGRVGYGCGDIPGLTRETKDLTDLIRFRAAQKAGLVAITQDGPGFWKVEGVGLKPDLLEHLRKVKHNQANGCDSVQLAFAVASKSAVAITALHKITDEKSEAEFTWQWVLTPAGTKLVNALSEQERRDLNADLENERRSSQRDPSFSLADMTQSTIPHHGKKALKKSGEVWTIDE